MLRISKIHFSGWVVLVLLAFWLGGCTASMEAKSAFEKAEHFSAEENFDQAVEKYFEASELVPSRKLYKMKLVSSRTRAAASHIKKARSLAKESNYTEALAEYRIARGFDPSIEVANQEAIELSQRLESQKFSAEAATFYQSREITLARKAVDKALKLDTTNAKAMAIKELLSKESHAIAMDGVDLDITSEEPITLRFKDANIKEVFDILSKLSGINFIYDEDIRDQSITVLLEKANFAQAMELILQMNGLDKKVLNSRTIIVYPETREKDKQYDDQLIQTFYLSHIDAKKAVNLLRTMLQLRKVYVHEERNALVIRDNPAVIKLAEQILNAADRGDSEVLFDLELVSVLSGDTLLFGPQITPQSIGVAMADSTGTNLISGTLPETTTTGLVQSLNGLQAFYTLPSATFDFLKTLEDSETLASPKIRVKNNEKAKVHVGTREPVVTATNNNGTTSESIQYVDVGVKLDVEPKIQLDGTVLAGIKLEVSDATYLEATDSGTTPIRIRTTNAETKLVLKDGERTILGGLFEQISSKNKSTIPFLGDIPFLGSLFTHFDNKDTKREILLSITPYIVKQVQVPDIDVATIWSGGEDNLKNGPNFGAFAKPFLSEVEATKPMAAPAVKKVVIAPLQTPTEELTVPAKDLASGSMQPAEDVPQEMAPAESTVESLDVVKEEPEVAAEAESLPSEPTPGELTAPEKVLASSMTQPAEVVPPDVQAIAEAETVATEEIPESKEVGVPLVLEMPAKKTPSLMFSGLEWAELGTEFTFSVEVRDVEKLYSAPLFINYDPAMLELISINEGAFLKQNGQSTVFSSSPNRTTGQVIVGYKQGSGGTGASGSGTLFNLNFKPKSAGKTKVEINRVNFRNPEGVRLQVTPGAATIEVR